ncbi:MAG TPA: alkaline phosphatase family protein [Candidatus Binatia bacterium]|nr:alkaline phosphatase family protein [Candidatus Binatia bacterium]
MAKRKTPETPAKIERARVQVVRDPLDAEISRRQFLTGLAATTGAIALANCGGGGGGGGGSPESEPLPNPQDSGIENVIVVMMENRSFDHFLGWVPGADGTQAGVEYPDKQGQNHPTYHLDTFQGCQFEDPDHSYRGGRVQYDDGANDGWLRAGTDDLFPIGYYVQDDLSFFGGAVPAWTTFDRYFCSILSSTYPNRFYQHAAQTDRLSNTLTISTIPTIWDRMTDKGLSWTYYYNDLPVTALWGQKYLPKSKLYPQFLEDAAAGNLPNLCFVDPRFVGEGQGLSNDDHPLADIRNGQAFLNEVYRAVTSSPNWENTVLVVNYDEWGGFYDHVPPPTAPTTDLDPVIGNDGRLGFRVPALVVSPLARRGFVAKEQYDHTSILTMVEWRWGLDPLSARDASANNLARVLDFRDRKDLSAPQFDVPTGPFGEVCIQGAAEARADLVGLKALAEANGFAVPR